MNHLGVLLHAETQVLVLHGFVVEVDLWDGRDHFAKLQVILPLLDILHRFLDASGTGRLQLSSVMCFSSYFALSSVVVLRFALPAVGYALVLSAVGFALLPAVGFALRAVLVLLLLYFILLVSDSLTTGSFGCGSVCATSSVSLCGSLRLRGSFLASPNTTTQHCATS